MINPAIIAHAMSRYDLFNTEDEEAERKNPCAHVETSEPQRRLVVNNTPHQVRTSKGHESGQLSASSLVQAHPSLPSSSTSSLPLSSLPSSTTGAAATSTSKRGPKTLLVKSNFKVPGTAVNNATTSHKKKKTSQQVLAPMDPSKPVYQLVTSGSNSFLVPILSTTVPGKQKQKTTARKSILTQKSSTLLKTSPNDPKQKLNCVYAPPITKLPASTATSTPAQNQTASTSSVTTTTNASKAVSSRDAVVSRDLMQISKSLFSVPSRSRTMISTVQPSPAVSCPAVASAAKKSTEYKVTLDPVQKTILIDNKSNSAIPLSTLLSLPKGGPSLKPSSVQKTSVDVDVRSDHSYNTALSNEARKCPTEKQGGAHSHRGDSCISLLGNRYYLDYCGSSTKRVPGPRRYVKNEDGQFVSTGNLFPKASQVKVPSGIHVPQLIRSKPTASLVPKTLKRKREQNVGAPESFFDDRPAKSKKPQVLTTCLQTACGSVPVNVIAPSLDDDEFDLSPHADMGYSPLHDNPWPSPDQRRWSSEMEESELRIDSVYSLADKIPSEAEGSDDDDTISLSSVEIECPVNDDPSTFNLSSSEWKNYCSPCFTVVERFSKEEIKAAKTFEEFAKCSNHCRKRHLDSLCQLSLLKCDNHPELDLMPPVKEVKLQQPSQNSGLSNVMPKEIVKEEVIDCDSVSLGQNPSSPTNDDEKRNTRIKESPNQPVQTPLHPAHLSVQKYPRKDKTENKAVSPSVVHSIKESPGQQVQTPPHPAHLSVQKYPTKDETENKAVSPSVVHKEKADPVENSDFVQAQVPDDKKPKPTHGFFVRGTKSRPHAAKLLYSDYPVEEEEPYFFSKVTSNESHHVKIENFNDSLDFKLLKNQVEVKRSAMALLKIQRRMKKKPVTWQQLCAAENSQSDKAASTLLTKCAETVSKEKFFGESMTQKSCLPPSHGKAEDNQAFQRFKIQNSKLAKCVIPNIVSQTTDATKPSAGPEKSTKLSSNRIQTALNSLSMHLARSGRKITDGRNGCFLLKIDGKPVLVKVTPPTPQGSSTVPILPKGKTPITISSSTQPVQNEGLGPSSGVPRSLKPTQIQTIHPQQPKVSTPQASPSQIASVTLSGTQASTPKSDRPVLSSSQGRSLLAVTSALRAQSRTSTPPVSASSGVMTPSSGAKTKSLPIATTRSDQNPCVSALCVQTSSVTLVSTTPQRSIMATLLTEHTSTVSSSKQKNKRNKNAVSDKGRAASSLLKNVVRCPISTLSGATAAVSTSTASRGGMAPSTPSNPTIFPLRTSSQPSTSISTTAARTPKIIYADTKSPLSHLPPNSSLLPERRDIHSSKPITKKERERRRRLLEAKYPLPPGVIIKTEPDDVQDFIHSQDTSTLPQTIQHSDHPEENTSENSAVVVEASSGNPREESSSENIQETFYPSQDTTFSEMNDEPPPLFEESTPSASTSKTECVDSDDEGMPPVLQPMFYSVSPSTSRLVSSDDLPSTSSLPETSATVGQSESVSSLASISSQESCDSGFASNVPSASSSTLSADRPALPPRPHRPSFQNPKIQQLKELLEKRKLEIEKIKRMSQEDPPLDY